MGPTLEQGIFGRIDQLSETEIELADRLPDVLGNLDQHPLPPSNPQERWRDYDNMTEFVTTDVYSQEELKASACKLTKKLQRPEQALAGARPELVAQITLLAINLGQEIQGLLPPGYEIKADWGSLYDDEMHGNDISIQINGPRNQRLVISLDVTSAQNPDVVASKIQRTHDSISEYGGINRLDYYRDAFTEQPIGKQYALEVVLGYTPDDLLSIFKVIQNTLRMDPSGNTLREKLATGELDLGIAENILAECKEQEQLIRRSNIPNYRAIQTIQQIANIFRPIVEQKRSSTSMDHRSTTPGSFSPVAVLAHQGE